MSTNVQFKAVGKNVINIVFFLAAFFIAAIFFIDQLYQASQKAFWGDEIYGIVGTTRGNSYLSLLFGGARSSQSSPSPLDYLFLKPLDGLSAAISCLGLKVEVYYRLIANLSTTLAAWGIFILFTFSKATEKRTNELVVVQSTLVIFAMIAFLFSRFVHYYAAEMRPYAIWNAMYMLALAVAILRSQANKLLVGVMVFLALSATASIFQLACLGVAYFCIHGINEGWKQSLLKSVKIFIVPMLVSLFYCLRVSHWSMVTSGGTWNDFLDLWINKATIIPMMLAVVALSLAKKETRVLAVVPLGFLLIFLAGPVIYKITEARGYFYSDRQYVYYDLGNAVFLLTLTQLIPYYLKNTMPKHICFAGLIIVLLFSGAVTFRKKVSRKIVLAVQHTGLIFKKPQSIEFHPGDLKTYFGK